MSTQNITKDAEKQNLTRRKFLTTGCLALSGVGIGLGAQKLLGKESPKPTTIPNINPGYVGPQFFDEREEQALLEVLESRSPFRFRINHSGIRVRRNRAFSRFPFNNNRLIQIRLQLFRNNISHHFMSHT